MGKQTHKEAKPDRKHPAKVESTVVAVRATDLAALQRSVTDPGRATPDDILALQQAYGNRAVPVLSQVEGPAPTTASRVATGNAGRGSQPAQRQAAEDEEVQTKPLAASITPLVQRQAEEEEEEVQTKPLLQPLGQLRAQRQAEEEEEGIQTKPVEGIQRQAEEEDSIADVEAKSSSKSPTR
jgi:hypothetical protein